MCQQSALKILKLKKFIKKIKNSWKKIENVPKTKLDTISLFRNDLDLVPKRREPQQRPVSPRYGTSSRSSISSSRRSKNHNFGLAIPELNIAFQELVPQRGDRGRCCGSRRFGTSSRSFLKSDMVSNFVFGTFSIFLLFFYFYFLLQFWFFSFIFCF